MDARTLAERWPKCRYNYVAINVFINLWDICKNFARPELTAATGDDDKTAI